MYRQYWNLRELPFLNTTDSRFVYMTDQHKEGLARLMFLASEGRMAGMLSGPFGVGKSLTLDLLQRHAEKIDLPCVRMDAIPGGMLPMAKCLLREIGIKDLPETLPDALMMLQMFCRNVQNPQRHLLLIDEAHYMALDDGYYFAHYLCNLRIPDKKTGHEIPLFTLVMVGTEALRDTVGQYESLRRRIQLDWVLEPLTLSETIEYVQFRMRGAGGDLWIFPQDALQEIYKWSAGVPRNINHLCDTALLLGFAGRLPNITREIIVQAAADTSLDRSRIVTDVKEGEKK